MVKLRLREVIRSAQGHTEQVGGPGSQTHEPGPFYFVTLRCGQPTNQPVWEVTILSVFATRGASYPSLKLAVWLLSLTARLDLGEVLFISSRRPREEQNQAPWLLGLGSATLGLSFPTATRNELASMQSKEPLRTDASILGGKAVSVAYPVV